MLSRIYWSSDIHLTICACYLESLVLYFQNKIPKKLDSKLTSQVKKETWLCIIVIMKIGNDLIHYITVITTTRLTFPILQYRIIFVVNFITECSCVILVDMFSYKTEHCLPLVMMKVFRLYMEGPHCLTHSFLTLSVTPEDSLWVCVHCCECLGVWEGYSLPSAHWPHGAADWSLPTCLLSTHGLHRLSLIHNWQWNSVKTENKRRI